MCRRIVNINEQARVKTQFAGCVLCFEKAEREPANTGEEVYHRESLHRVCPLIPNRSSKENR
jgi:hypothetical protein